jgi:hypothetical protein
MQAWMEGYVKMDIKPLMLNNTHTVLQGAGFNSQMTVYAKANYGHSCIDLLGFFLFLCFYLL